MRQIKQSSEGFMMGAAFVVVFEWVDTVLNHTNRRRNNPLVGGARWHHI